jgi:hypothetical protein
MSEQLSECFRFPVQENTGLQETSHTTADHVKPDHFALTGDNFI